MATRADRLNERLRGAQRTNLDDDDTFGLDIGLDIPGVAIPPAAAQPEPAPATRATPGPAKRQRLDRSGSSRSTSSQGGSSGRRSARNRPQTASSLQDVPEEPSPAPRTSTTSGSRRNPAATSSPIPRDPQTDDPEDEFEALPAPRSSKSPATRASLATVTTDEVEESPVNAPGSGRRRTRTSVAASASSVRLQDVLGSEEPAASSSPSARVAKRKNVASALPAQTSRRSARASSLRQDITAEEADELSPDRPRDAPHTEDVAEEIEAVEAAKVLGRPRPSRVASRLSPNLGSRSPQAEEEEEAEEPQEPAPKRRKGRPAKSPVAQKQPSAAKTAAKAKATRRTSGDSNQGPAKAKTDKPKSAPKPRKRKSTAAADRNDEEDEVAADDNTAIEITVQRFVNHKKRGGGDDEEDPLHSEIPFANRTGESSIDVLAQVCEEVINNTMGQFHELLSTAGTEAAKKKEYRIKMRAIEAYKEELNSRFLQHAIHLDHSYSLRKRVRHVQKEKLTLRDDILKLKAEREQVALRMDAIRTKHEADTKEATYRLDTSALMHDIELAVEEGQKAPELTPKQQKEADLANLELLIAQVADQASSKSGPGGLLQQVSDFNAFLERAAVALESR